MPVPEVAPDGNDGGTSSDGSDDILSEDATNTTDQRSPGSVAAAGLASPIPVTTPPLPLDIDETPGTKKNSQVGGLQKVDVLVLRKGLTLISLKLLTSWQKTVSGKMELLLKHWMTS